VIGGGLEVWPDLFADLAYGVGETVPSGGGLTLTIVVTLSIELGLRVVRGDFLPAIVEEVRERR
jgi:hypothetical protein